MGVMQRERSNKLQRNGKKTTFYDFKKIMKIKKINQKKKKLTMTYLLSFLFLASFYNIFVFFFSKRDKMRCVCVRGNDREKKSIENAFFFYSYLLQYVFFLFGERDKKMRCIGGNGDGKELEKCGEYFFRSLFT